MLNGVVIPYGSKVKNLGLILDRNLNWGDNVGAICSKVFNVLRRLWPITAITNLNLRRKLVISLCMPHFLYADIVQYQYDSKCKRRIQLAFNACTRYVHRLSKYDHISSFNESILGCEFSNYIDNRILTFIFKIIHGMVPHYLSDKIGFVRSERTRHLLTRRHRTAMMSNSIFVSGVRLWNSLPNETRDKDTLSGFRRACQAQLSTT